MCRLLMLILGILTLSACSDEARIGFANALGNAAYRIERGTTCTTTSYRVKGGYTATTSCY